MYGRCIVLRKLQQCNTKVKGERGIPIHVQNDRRKRGGEHSLLSPSSPSDAVRSARAAHDNNALLYYNPPPSQNRCEFGESRRKETLWGRQGDRERERESHAVRLRGKVKKTGYIIICSSGRRGYLPIRYSRMRAWILLYIVL